MAESDWTDAKRVDGVTVIQGMDGWIIMPADEARAVDHCLCCGALLRSMRQAQRLADFHFPLQGPVAVRAPIELG